MFPSSKYHPKFLAMAAKSKYSFKFVAFSRVKLFILAAVAITFLVAIYLSNSSSSTPADDVLSSQQHNSQPYSAAPAYSDHPSSSNDDRTGINHIVFSLVGSTKAWKHRKAYIESWWRPNVTRGYLYLDTPPTQDLLPWSPNSPTFKISDNTTKTLPHKAPVAIRIIHAVMEVFREGDENVRWYVMGDDDSIFILENWIDVLNKYDHTKYVYVGGHSESVVANIVHSFEMGFGGAGFALSYPLVQILFKELENCIRRYPLVIAADQMLMQCVADFGVSASFERGIHQVDLRGDISGFLSSHPQAPLMSLHHFDMVSPIFPSKTRADSTTHLMKAAKADHVRLLQQTVCYHKPTNWSFSVSWGYSTHIYENVIPRSELKKPIETFTEWARKTKAPFHLMNMRKNSTDPCLAPHIFFLDSIGNKTSENQIVTNYTRLWKRGTIPCSSSGNHSAEHVTKIQVQSPMTKPIQTGKSECCEVLQPGDDGTAMVKIRECFRDELIA